jgi:hypothetical protein
LRLSDSSIGAPETVEHRAPHRRASRPLQLAPGGQREQERIGNGAKKPRQPRRSPAKVAVTKLVTRRQSLQFSLLSKLTYSHHHPVKNIMRLKLTICNSLSHFLHFAIFYLAYLELSMKIARNAVDAKGHGTSFSTGRG